MQSNAESMDSRKSEQAETVNEDVRLTKDTHSQEKPAVRLSLKKKLLFSSVIFIVFLCLLEVALRLVGFPRTLRQDTGLMYVKANAFNYEHTPGWSGYHAGAIMRINSFGFRGKEFSIAKPPGTVRVLGIGDSFTLGAAVGDDDTYLAQLEEVLNQDGRAHYETINAGHQNASTLTEYKYLKERNLMSLDPDVVVLGFTMHNDANPSGEVQDPGEDQVEGRYGRVLKKQLSKASPVLRIVNSSNFQRLSDSCRIVKLLEHGINWSHESTITEVSYRVILEQYKDGSKSWENCRNSLLAIYRACNENNVPLVVVLFPIFNKKADQPFKDYPQEARDLEGKLKAVFAQSSGVMVVSILDDLAASVLTTRELRVPIDGHPNRLWHEITARRLYATLKEIGL